MLKNTNIDAMGRLVEVYGRSANFKQFNHCQAYVSEAIFCSAEGVNFRLVKSYNTIVAFINLDTAEYIELGKWSRTTSKQVTQIHNQLFSDFTRIYRNIY